MPHPIANIEMPKDIKIGETKQIQIMLLNQGDNSLIGKSAFSGFHVEVENATVDAIKTDPDDNNNITIKTDAWRGNTFWFEAKLPPLAANKSGKLIFNITPFASPVNIYYRVWLPGVCSKEKQIAALKGLRSFWQSIEKGGWRNEECIQRAPANDSQEIICPVAVYAAHKDLQNFRCYKAEMMIIK